MQTKDKDELHNALISFIIVFILFLIYCHIDAVMG